MINKTVSVIVPVYNAEKYIEKCINSLLNQTYQNLQIILVNDGSRDGSGLICDQIASQDPRVYVIHQENKGVSAARNSGLRIAEGEYITFVDADDTLQADAIMSAQEILSESNSDVVVYGWNIVHESGSVVETYVRGENTEDMSYVIREVLKDYACYGGGYPWNKMWRKSAIVQGEEISLFDTELYYFEDLEWVIRALLRVQKVTVCPQILYSYYIREDSVTNSKKQEERRELGYHHSVKKIIQDLEPLQEVQKWFAEKYAPEVINGVVHAKRNGWIEAEKYLQSELMEWRHLVLKSSSISIKVKIRCIWLLLQRRVFS